MTFVLNTLFAAIVIAFVSWLSGKAPVVAGLIAALPLSTMLILPLSQAQYGDVENTVVLARSIFLATPITLLFFVPFLFANRLQWPFWKLYLAGFGLLVAGFLVFRLVAPLFVASSK